MISLEVIHYFDAAHKLPDVECLESKACARLHGHTYAVKVNIESDALNEAGMVIDFKSVKRVIDILDHNYINEVFETNGFNFPPTAEYTAVFIAQQVEQLGVKVSSVAVCEGYKGLERASWAIYKKD